MQAACVVRFQGVVQRSARNLLGGVGLGVSEMKDSGRRTLCRGEGSAVACLSSGLAGSWRKRRSRQARGRPIVTYCAGCAYQPSDRARTRHVLDLLFEPVAALEGRVRVARAPLTYLHRLLLKRRLRKIVAGAVTRERPAAVAGSLSRDLPVHPVAAIEALVAAVPNSLHLFAEVPT